MSHYTKIETKFKDLQCLEKALYDIGFIPGQIEIHEKPQNLYGYRGDMRPEVANVIIRRQFIGRVSNDVGFVKDKNGFYSIIVSDYDQGSMWPVEKTEKLTARYAYRVTKKAAKLKGYMVQEKTLEDGTIKLTLSGM